MEIGSLHNMLVINNELWAYWHMSAMAEGALYKQGDANDERKQTGALNTVRSITVEGGRCRERVEL